MVIKVAICGGGSAGQRHVKALLRRYLQVKDLYYEIDLYRNTKMLSEEETVYDLLFLSVVAEKDGVALNKSLREKNPLIRIIYVRRAEESMEIVNLLDAADHLVKPFSTMEFFRVLQSSLEYLHHEGMNKRIFLKQV